MSEVHSATSLRLPALLDGSEDATERSAVTWLVGEGQAFEAGQPLAYLRAYHPNLRTRWWDSRTDAQAVLSIPEPGTITSLSTEHGGWNSLAGGTMWNETRELGASYRGTGSVAGTRDFDCTIIYADRFHSFLEPRAGGILTSPLQRVDVWSHAPSAPKLKVVALGVCDLVALLGAVNGDYHRWTRLFAPSSQTTITSDLVLAHSSHYLLQELTATDAERKSAADDVADLMRVYLEETQGDATSNSGVFLSLLLKYVKAAAVRSELDEGFLTAARPDASAHKFIVFALNNDSVVHLRSKNSKLVFSMPLFRFQSFDKPLARLLRKRFSMEEANPDVTVANYRKIVPLVKAAGYEPIFATLALQHERVFQFKPETLNVMPGYWMRRTNVGIRELASEIGAGIVNFDSIVARKGTSRMADAGKGVPHYSNVILDQMRLELAKCFVERGLPSEFLSDSSKELVP